ncbi:MAG TPA: tetratricopeptide repeat protein [Bacteroidales bacterium]|nr:tetratricopeptide repeat protein [Bacteroidales bacterium]
MKQLIIFALGLLLTADLSAQNDKIDELISQGTALHDQGRYDEAISKYKAALEIDNNSLAANYELSYTYMATQQYEKAIKHSQIVIEQNIAYLEEAYIVLGSSQDMLGQPDKAIKSYEEGLTKYPNSNLLNYNLALTLFNQKDYEGAEEAAIKAVLAKPSHGSSHILLAAIMQIKGQRVKCLMSLYYFLMVEPDSKRSEFYYKSLMDELGTGVAKEGKKKINVSISSTSVKDEEFGAADMMVSMLAASRFIDENKKKSEMEMFVENNRSFFSVLGELKKDHKGFWWDFYVTRFNSLLESENCEAFSYYISQSANSQEVTKWISKNPKKMEKFNVWLENL